MTAERQSLVLLSCKKGRKKTARSRRCLITRFANPTVAQHHDLVDPDAASGRGLRHHQHVVLAVADDVALPVLRDVSRRRRRRRHRGGSTVHTGARARARVCSVCARTQRIYMRLRALARGLTATRAPTHLPLAEATDTLDRTVS